MADSARIRSATATDSEALATLWDAFMREQAAHDDRLQVAADAAERWHNDLPVWLDDSTVRIWVAEGDDGAPVGFARAHRTGPPPVYADCAEVYLDEVFVDAGHRRNGLATALVDAAASWAASVNADRLRLSTVAANAGAEAFWRHWGAAPLSTMWTAPIAGESDAGAAEGDVNEGSAKIGFDWN